MKKFLSISIFIALIFSIFSIGCNKTEEKVTEVNRNIILATTTSTRDSGLLDYLLPKFEKETGINVKVVAVGTGKALQMGIDGEADILLVHAKESEEEFVKNGHGLERHDVMYNDFVLVGPKEDKAKVKEKAPDNIVKAIQLIAKDKLNFVSRGDDSGTHKKEKALWQEALITPEGDWYISAGKGMADVLKIADEKLAYTLTDRATYLNLKDTLDLEILVEKDERLFNQYGIIPVNPNKNPNINGEDARIFMDWMLSENTQKLIGEYGKDKFGMPLFMPNAK